MNLGMKAMAAAVAKPMTVRVLRVIFGMWRVKIRGEATHKMK